MPNLTLTRAAPSVAYAQDFDGPTVSGWALFPTNDEFAQTQRDLFDGAYRWRITALNEVFSWMSSDEPAEVPTPYFWYTVTARMGDAPADIHYGLLFDVRDGGNLYYFQVSQTGQFALYDRRDNRFTPLLAPANSDAIHTGPHAVNRLAVENDDGTVALYANQQILGQYELEIEQGAIGLGVELHTGQVATLYFDDVLVCTTRCE